MATEYLGRPLATDYSGIYTLTLIADDCTAEVPEVLKRRVYTARIEQIGATLDVFLAGADFLPFSNGFTGLVVSTDEIRFSIASGSDYYDTAFFEVGEKVGEGTLAVNGIFNATTSIVGARMNGASTGNQGNIFLDIGVAFSEIDWVCSIKSFELTRQ